MQILSDHAAMRDVQRLGRSGARIEHRRYETRSCGRSPGRDIGLALRLSGGALYLPNRMLIRTSNTRRLTVPGRTRVTTASPKPVKIHAIKYEGEGATPLVEVKFGRTTILAERPSEADMKRSLAVGRRALKALLNGILNPGTTLRHPPWVPLFEADPLDPARVVRILHGKVERGHFVKGKFKPDKSPA